MALTINTNVAALNAHMNMKKNDNALSGSLERLSTGMRINKAADDASGMAIADSLKAQGLGLGQAIRNANDGINIVQTADGALDEAIKITNTIKTKAIQAAQDGQTFESRKIIQEDINKLLEEVDLLASSTSFNGKKLLSGEFTNKSFQVGASSGEVAKISIGSAETAKTGHVTTSNMKINNEGTLGLTIHSNTENKDYNLQAVDMKFNNSAENGAGALAAVINKMSDQLGITAQAVVETESRGSIKAGEIQQGFKINGVDIGAVSVQANDTDGALAKAINTKSDQTGVTASVDSNGKLTLNAADGRGIKLEGDVRGVMTKSAAEMSTFGELKLTQFGSNSLLIKDSDSGIQTKVGSLVSSGTIDVSNEMLLGADSFVASGSILQAGTRIGKIMDSGGVDKYTTAGAKTTSIIDHNIAAGSTLLAASTIAKGTTIGGNILKNAAAQTITGDAILAKGSTIGSGSFLAAGIILTDDIKVKANDGTINTIKAGSKLDTSVSIVSDVILTSDMEIKDSDVDSILTEADGGSIIAIGSRLSNDNILLDANVTTSVDFTLLKGSGVTTGSTYAAGSVLGVEDVVGTEFSVISSVVVSAGSKLEATTQLAAGSTIGGDITMGTDKTLDGDLTIGAGSVLMTGSVIAAGTYLTNGIMTDNGQVGPGVTLEQDAVLTSSLFLTEAMDLKASSALKTGSIIQSTGGGTASDISFEDT
ncbi:MAG: hypothetical protein HQK68_11620, partial [Desulfamplus sp.]|nr:hypothetical protein [Desulfamplus sp.]